MLLRVNVYVVDATIRQAELPEKDIVLPDMVVTRNAEVLVRDGKLLLEVNGCHLIYRPIEDESYRTAPDWKRRTNPYRQTVQKILQRIGGSNHG